MPQLHQFLVNVMLGTSAHYWCSNHTLSKWEPINPKTIRLIVLFPYQIDLSWSRKIRPCISLWYNEAPLNIASWVDEVYVMEIITLTIIHFGRQTCGCTPGGCEPSTSGQVHPRRMPVLWAREDATLSWRMHPSGLSEEQDCSSPYNCKGSLLIGTGMPQL